jgi:hypothetical protein
LLLGFASKHLESIWKGIKIADKSNQFSSEFCFKIEAPINFVEAVLKQKPAEN